MTDFSDRYGNLRSLLTLAVWFALIAGFTEAAILVVRQHLLHQFVWASRDVLWMAPLSYAVFFIAGAMILAVVALFYRGLSTLYITVLAFSFTAALSLLGMWAQIHRVSRILFALGMAVQAARYVSAHPVGFARLVRRSTAVLGCLVVAIGVIVPTRRALVTRRTEAAMSPSRLGAPNVLLLILDTVGAENLSLYGYGRPTSPGLSEWAKRGVTFARAISTSSWTLPAHGTLFTGRYPHELSADWLTPLDSTYPTIAEVFRREGYVTAGFVANYYYTTYESGLGRGFTIYDDLPVTLRQVAVSSSLGVILESFLRRTAYGSSPFAVFQAAYRSLDVPPRRSSDRRLAAELNARFLGWLSTRPDRPFFAFVNYFDAHTPYVARPPFAEKFVSRAGVRDAYDAAIAYLDHHVSLLLRELELRGVLANTLVIITSDHGELLGDSYGLRGHGNSLYIPLLHVPLIVLGPHVPAGARIARPISLRDVAATVADLTGLSSSYAFPGTSLAHHWAGSGPNDDVPGSPLLSEVGQGVNSPSRHPVSRGPMKSLVEGHWHYILNGDETEELYDLRHKPTAPLNLATSLSGRLVVRALRDSLRQALGNSSLRVEATAARTSGRNPPNDE